MTHDLTRSHRNHSTEEESSTPPPPSTQRHLFESRTVLITGGIDQELAHKTCATLLAMAQVSDDPITVIVSSPGGHVESGDMIHDMIRFIGPKVNIVGMGWVASAGALIYISVPTEQRFCTPNTRFLLHQPSGGAGGQASDIAIQAEQLVKMRSRLNQMFAEATGQTFDRIETITDRDYWMNAEESVAFGLAGTIINSASDVA